MEALENVLKQFLEKWPVKSLEKLTLEEYALGNKNYKETFSYWVETEAKLLGDISGLGGGGSFKHGIYYMSNKKNYESNQYSNDNEYAWISRLGKDKEEAFNNVKNTLLKVVKAAQDMKLEDIDSIPFYAATKWKWAFLYSQKQLLPVYKKDALEIAAEQLEFEGSNKDYPTLYRFLLEKKENAEGCFQFGERVWNLYMENKPVNYYIIGSKYGAANDVFPEMFNLNVVSTGFAIGYDLKEFLGKPQKEIVNYLKEKGEEVRSYNCLKYFLNMKPGDRIAVKADGSPKGLQGFLSIVGIAEIKDIEEFYSFDPDSLGHMLAVDWIQAPIYQEFEYGGYGRTIHKLTDKNIINEIFSRKYEPIPLPNISLDSNHGKDGEFSLNQILYGPPGTGKTYHTINKAIEIINPEFDLNQDRKITKKEYDRLMKEGQIAFCTFHQSMSYEDFVEGIKPVTEKGEVVYEVVDGIFKEICSKAKSKLNENFDEAFGLFTDNINNSNQEYFQLSTIKGKPFWVSVNSNGNLSIYTTEKKNYQGSLTKENLKRFANGENTFLGWEGYATGAINILKEKFELSDIIEDNTQKKFVLIIDEINRGNISKIFGELITLIEKDKRIGEDEELRVVLPYSKNKEEMFGVPNNLYIIGTMNTADRSIALMDTALRRRFEFVEMMPKPDKLKPTSEGIDLKLLLEKINERIEFLYDRDHTIGHSYFMKVNSKNELCDVFRNKIIPLLQEYFYNDWEKIQLVLGDNDKWNKDDKYRLVKKIKTYEGKDEEDLFGEDLDDYEDIAKYEISEALRDRKYDDIHVDAFRFIYEKPKMLEKKEDE